MRRWPLLLALLFLAACSPQSPSSEVEPPLQPAAAPALGDICAALIPEQSLDDPPAVPGVGLPGSPGLRIVAFGDFGEQPNRNTAPQNEVAQAITAYHADQPFDFGLTLGDNFYPAGLPSPTDPRWTSQWERLYSPMGIRVYAILGNHDYKNARSPGAEMARSRHSATWCLPRPYFTFTAGAVQFFAVDTTPVEEPGRDPGGAMAAQRQWLDRALAASRARWKIVYGHHPVYSNGEHGGRSGTLPRIKSYLLPLLLKHKVDVYLSGHDHSLEALEPEGGVHFFVSGGAGRHLRDFDRRGCQRWGKASYGFTVLETDATGLSLKVSFVEPAEDASYRVVWGPEPVRKGASSACRVK
ncbi:MAG TPA: metallophosphoesterase [Thermoanaerobaculia bacterium]|nr:metallophosphoesterase [Thermoanaerobaculia bacterium]